MPSGIRPASILRPATPPTWPAWRLSYPRCCRTCTRCSPITPLTPKRGSLTPLEQAGVTVVIPPKAHRLQPRPYDKHRYQARHLIENFFAKLKHYRALATRYDKRAVSFLGAIHLAASVILLN